MEENETSVFQHALKWGGIVGVISIALTGIAYAVDYSYLADWKFGIFVLLLFLGLTIYGGINFRNEIGGFLSYGKAWQHGFVLMVVSGLISTCFTLLLYTVIDPELPAKLTEVAMENAEKMMERFGMPADQMDKALEDAQVRTENQFKPMGLIKSFGIGIIVYAVIALVTAIFVRKNPPEEAI
jgi:hypothetical protein